MNTATIFQPFVEALEPRVENFIMHVFIAIILGALIVVARTEWKKRRASR